MATSDAYLEFSIIRNPSYTKREPGVNEQRVAFFQNITGRLGNTELLA